MSAAVLPTVLTTSYFLSLVGYLFSNVPSNRPHIKISQHGLADSALSVFWYLCFTVLLREEENRSKLGHDNHLPKRVLMKTNTEMNTSPESCRGPLIYQRRFWNGFPSLLPDIVGIKWYVFEGHYLSKGLLTRPVFIWNKYLIFRGAARLTKPFVHQDSPSVNKLVKCKSETKSILQFYISITNCPPYHILCCWWVAFYFFPVRFMYVANIGKRRIKAALLNVLLVSVLRGKRKTIRLTWFFVSKMMRL